MLDHPFVAEAIGWILTYSIHSTAALVLAWVTVRITRQSVLDEELMLRTALLVSLASATGQSVWGQPLWSLPSPLEVASVDATAQPRQGGERVNRASTRQRPGENKANAPRKESTGDRRPGAKRGARAETSPPGDEAALASASSEPNRPRSKDRTAGKSEPRAPTESSINHPDETTQAFAATLPWSVLSLWIAGVLVVAWTTLRSGFGVRRLLRNAYPATDGDALATLEELRQTAGIRRKIQLWITPAGREPTSIGLWRLRITVPEAALDILGREEGRALLAHEVAHLKRGDSWWQLLQLALRTFAWVQPLNLWAIRHLERLAERACDDWAVEATGQPLELASCLTEVAGWTIQPRHPLAVRALTGARSELSRRVARLLDRPLERRWTTAGRQAVVVLAAIVLACLPGVSRPVWAQEPSPTVRFDARDHRGPGAGSRLPKAAPNSSSLVPSLPETAELTTQPELWRAAQQELEQLALRIAALRRMAEKRRVTPQFHEALKSLEQREQALRRMVVLLRARLASELDEADRDDSEATPRSRSH